MAYQFSRRRPKIAIESRFFILTLLISGTVTYHSMVLAAESPKDCGPVPLGGTFDKGCKIQLVLPPAASLASDHQVFFDLHQVIGFLEAYKKNKCLSGIHSADDHLKILRKAKLEITTPRLKSMLSDLESIRIRINGAKVEELESLRDQLHSFGTTHHLRHENAWHFDFQKC